MQLFKISYKRGIKFFLMLFLGLNALSGVSQVTLESHQELNREALRFWHSDPNKPSHLFNRNISPKGDCIQAIDGYVFFTWFKGGMQDRNLMLSRLNLATNNWVHIQFPDKSTLYQGVHKGKEQTGAGNSHRTACVGVSPKDGTIHLVYDMHAGELNYRGSLKNVAYLPDNEFTIDKFSARRNYLKNGEPILSFTYPNIQVNDAGELILEYRRGTSRQGDKYLIVYDGNSWSSAKLVMQGNNENPEFNQYGGFAYAFGNLYMGCAVRIKDSPIEFNQGFYFAKVGQNGTDGQWENFKGEKFNLPIKGMTQMNKLKFAEPLPPGNEGMTAAPNFVVSKNGAIHFTNRVSGQGTVHYYTAPGSTTVRNGGGAPNISFGADDGRVYGIELSANKIRVKSTNEGENSWRTDYVWGGNERFGLMSYEYYKGKIHIVATEDRESDKLAIHYVRLKVGTQTGDNTPPVVSFTKPANTDLLEGYSSLDVEVNATDANGVEKVELFINDQPVRIENGAPYEWSTTSDNQLANLSVGTHTLKAIATDTEGNSGQSQITINVIERCPVVRASTNDGNGPENVLDDNLQTRWSASGSGEYIEFCLDNPEIINQVSIAFYNGDQRKSFFDIHASLDGVNFSPVKTGLESSGSSTELERFSIPSTELVKLRIVGQGNSSSAWNSYAEVKWNNVITGINDPSVLSIEVYPNPSENGVFHLSKSILWEVFTLKGELIDAGLAKDIDLSSQADGVFVLKTQGQVFKLIK